MQRLLKNESGIGIILVVLIVLGVVVVGAVVAGAVILTNDAAITVHNQSCGTLDIAEGSGALGFNFLPGINVPEQIAEGETVVVQFPKMFIDTVTIEYGSVQMEAFGRIFTFGTYNLDMESSTWDGTPLSALAGSQVELTGEHTLVLECR